MTEPADQTKSQDAPSWVQVMWSTLAAFFGVQSSQNRERDFSRGKASHFIVMGLLMTAAFIAVVVGAVKLALHFAATGA
nr:DUF2970 domain-containing protein [Oceanococcus sp. HetDA_MAG_MS8]